MEEKTKNRLRKLLNRSKPKSKKMNYLSMFANKDFNTTQVDGLETVVGFVSGKSSKIFKHECYDTIEVDSNDELMSRMKKMAGPGRFIGYACNTTPFDKKISRSNKLELNSLKAKRIR